MRMDFVNSGGGGAARLRYQGADNGGVMGIIPATALRTAEVNTVAGTSNAVVLGTGIGNTLNVSNNSTVKLTGGNFTQLQLGNSTFANGSTLNIATDTGQTGKALRLAGSTSFGTGVTLALTGDGTNGANLYLDGALSDGGVATTITKSGNGRLFLTNSTSANSLLAGSTIDVTAGSISLQGSSATGAFNPAGNAKIRLSGAGTSLILDSKVGSTTASTTYGNAIDVTENATIQDIVSGGSIVTLSGAIDVAATKTLTLDAIKGAIRWAVWVPL